MCLPIFLSAEHNQKDFMKHHGSILEFHAQRNNELMKAFRETLEKMNFINLQEAAVAVVNTPCSRFWVSEERATAVIKEMLKGRPIVFAMRPPKREMFEEIYRRVMVIRDTKPDVPLYDIVFEVVNSPAPKFYMDPACAINYICWIKNGRYRT